MQVRILVLIVVAACSRPQRAAASPAAKSPGVMVMPVLISGKEEIPPSDPVKRAMVVAGQRKLTASLKVCGNKDGAVKSADPVATSGYPEYDDALRTDILTWRYRPLTVDGEPKPFCKQLTFVFRMVEPYWSPTAIKLDVLHEGLISQVEVAAPDCAKMENALTSFAATHKQAIMTVQTELDAYEAKVRTETSDPKYGVGFGDTFVRSVGRHAMLCADKQMLTRALFRAGFRPAGPRL